MTEILEAIMLAAFSVGWYCSIWKMLRTGQAVGKSIFFVLLICSGYACGTLSKIVTWYETGYLSHLVWIYGWNIVVTGFDAWLVVRFSRGTEVPSASGLFMPLRDRRVR